MGSNDEAPMLLKISGNSEDDRGAWFKEANDFFALLDGYFGMLECDSDSAVVFAVYATVSHGEDAIKCFHDVVFGNRRIKLSKASGQDWRQVLFSGKELKFLDGDSYPCLKGPRKGLGTVDAERPGKAVERRKLGPGTEKPRKVVEVVQRAPVAERPSSRVVEKEKGNLNTGLPKKAVLKANEVLKSTIRANEERKWKRMGISAEQLNLEMDQYWAQKGQKN